MRFLWVLIWAYPAGMLALILLVFIGSSQWYDYTEPCDESYFRKSAPYFPEFEDTPTRREEDSSISSWREIDEAGMLSELEAGADITATDRFGQTLLHWAARCNRRVGVTALLLDHGSDVNARDNSDLTPLMFGVEEDNAPAVLELLLDRGRRHRSQGTRWRHAVDKSGLGREPGNHFPFCWTAARMSQRETTSTTPSYTQRFTGTSWGLSKS